MKDKYLKNFKDKTKAELTHIVTNPKEYNQYAAAAAHELLRKKTATFSEYQALTNGNTFSSETTRSNKSSVDKSFLEVFLTILKWIGIILFFPLSLVVVGYYKNKKAKKEYYANNRPHSERNT
ncbi:hypothetical protein H2O64_05160 [Kordia sp. YSTF-M3]|uniref:Uncharacterized protein n=1 Tax=Kordia aestuariivivens TaxID=2759037 RepID=A0ABR7Q647_9FLAO|nr:hypothetical protein [Kordia aestuariivivens]MBC8754049.1 hypothetical protein [Kordia aestuariivivens]